MRRGWTDGATLDVAQRDDAPHARRSSARRCSTPTSSRRPREVGDALTAVMESFWMMMLPFADVLERLPVPRLRRGPQARAPSSTRSSTA